MNYSDLTPEYKFIPTCKMVEYTSTFHNVTAIPSTQKFKYVPKQNDEKIQTEIDDVESEADNVYDDC